MCDKYLLLSLPKELANLSLTSISYTVSTFLIVFLQKILPHPVCYPLHYTITQIQHVYIGVLHLMNSNSQRGSIVVFIKFGFCEWICLQKYVKDSLQFIRLFNNQLTSYFFFVFKRSSSVGGQFCQKWQLPILALFSKEETYPALQKSTPGSPFIDSQLFKTNFSLISTLAFSAYELYFCLDVYWDWTCFMGEESLYHSFFTRISRDLPNIYSC